MLLTDTAVRQAKSKKKLYNLCDGRGLSLQVPARGSKRWEFRFQWHGRTSKLAFGTYPEIKLKDARELREEARSVVRGQARRWPAAREVDAVDPGCGGNGRAVAAGHATDASVDRAGLPPTNR